MMQRIVLACLCLLLAVPVLAVESPLHWLPGTGQKVAEGPVRDYTFCYHDSTDSFHLYGPTEWAVRFDFAAVYDSTFTVQKARLRFPNTGYTVKVALHEDTVAGPGVLITQKTQSISQNWTDFVFTSPSTHRVVWLVVTDTTNAYTRWVSASDGGGANSYFLNNATNPYWQSFSSAGYNCELLFGLVGRFNNGVQQDLELLDFGLTGELLPSEIVNPTFAIYNHGPEDISNWQLDLQLTFPTVTDTTFLTLNGNQTLIKNTLYETPATGFNYPITLPRDCSQMKVKATLVSQFAETAETLANNSVSKLFAVFTDTLNLHIIENFQREGSEFPLPVASGFDNLVYYPNLSDEFSNIGSYQRFNWYAFNSLPKQVIDGKKRIHYYDSAAYPAIIESALTQARRAKTYINRSTCTVSRDSLNDESLIATLKLYNDQTQLFSSDLNNPTLNSQLFVGMFKRFGTQSTTPYILQRWLGFAVDMDSTLAINTSITKIYTFNVAGIDTLDLQQNYRIYYWLQDKTGGQVHYVSSASFNSGSYTELEDELLPIPKWKAYPNPLRKSDALKLSGISGKQRISIYNLRGQKLFSQALEANEISIPASLFPSSGIYFIRSEVPGDKRIAKQTIKLSVIK